MINLPFLLDQLFEAKQLAFDFGTKPLFHTTSFSNLASILQTKTLQAHPFVSMSEVPFTGDISHNDVILVFSRRALAPQMAKVQYTERWYDAHPDHAAYIAGEGWQEQYTEPDDCYDYDDETGWEEADDDCLERAHREAEMQSFLYKDGEREWVSKQEGRDVRFGPRDVKGLIAVNSQQVALASQLASKFGLRVPVNKLTGYRRPWVG